MSLRQLLERFEQTNQRRAAGGVNAIAGFDFQIRVYLAEFIEAFAASLDLDDIGSEFANGLEALSDFSTGDSDSLTLVQVKRTIRKASLSSAANEFSEIELFLQNEPNCDLAPRFRVVGHRTELDPIPDWREINLPAQTRRGKTELVSIWNTIKQAGRLDQVEIEPDPWWRTLVAAYKCLDRPVEFARKAFEICMRRGELEATQVRDQIVELIGQHATDTPSICKALSSEDFLKNDSDSLHDLKVGFRPSLALLRDRQFMQRAKQVSEIISQIEKTRDEGSSLYNQIPVIWISGRSGCGKSVLLLQAMESLVQKRRNVIWLSDDRINL